MRRETWKKAHRRPQGGLKPRRAWKNEGPRSGSACGPGGSLPCRPQHTPSPLSLLSHCPCKTEPECCLLWEPSLFGPTLYWGNSWDPGPGDTPQPHQCPRQNSRTFCSRLCKTSTLPQLWQDGPQPSTAVGQSRKGVPSGPWEAVLSLLREKPDCQGISQGPLRPADLSSPEES